MTFWIGVLFIIIPIVVWPVLGRRLHGCIYLILTILTWVLAIFFIGSYFAFRPVRDDQVMLQLRAMAAPHPLTYQELVRVKLTDDEKIYEFPGGNPNNLIKITAQCNNRAFMDPLCIKIKS